MPSDEVMGIVSKLLDFPTLPMWNGTDFNGKDYDVCDGGGTDNMALLPSLRRGVKSILIFAPVYGDIAKFLGLATGTDSVDEPLESASASGEDAFAAECNDVSAYFGAIPEGKGPIKDYGSRPQKRVQHDVFNRHLQVWLCQWEWL